MSWAYTEAGKILIEVDKEHFWTDGVYTPWCKVHDDPNSQGKTLWMSILLFHVQECDVDRTPAGQRQRSLGCPSVSFRQLNPSHGLGWQTDQVINAFWLVITKSGERSIDLRQTLTPNLSWFSKVNLAIKSSESEVQHPCQISLGNLLIPVDRTNKNFASSENQ